MKKAQWTIKCVGKIDHIEKTCVVELASKQSWSPFDVAEIFEHLAKEIHAGKYDKVLVEALGATDIKMTAGAFSLEEIEQARAMIGEKQS